MRRPLFLVAAASLLFSACSTTPPERHTYLLRSSSHPESGQLGKAIDSYLGELQVANYIDQSGLVLELSDGEIHSAKQHLWAEPLRISLREFLSTEISAELGAPLATASFQNGKAKRIDVSVSQLHGDALGNAVLIASWSLGTSKKHLDYQFAETMPLEGTGYAALVEAETKLLIELSKSIARELK